MNAIIINDSAPYLMQRYVGPYKVARWLEKHGYQCRVLDWASRLTTEQILSILNQWITKDTYVIGISTTFMCLDTHLDPTLGRIRIPTSVLSALKEIKKTYPNIKIVAGGYGADTMPGYGVIDAVMISYQYATEEIFLEYLEHLILGTIEPIKKPQRLLNEQRWVYIQSHKQSYNIEHDDFNWKYHDAIIPGEPLPLDVSRGCIFACRFCQYPHLGRSKLDYTRHMELIKQELINNYQKFGTTMYYMLDDTFNDTLIKMQQFYDMTQTLPFKIQYVAYIRADLIDRFPDMAPLLQGSGLIGAYHGLESLHPVASKILGKGWSGKKARDYIPKLYHDIWGKKVAQHLNFITGWDQENIDFLNTTRDWFCENQLYSINWQNLSLQRPGFQSPTASEFDRSASKYGFQFNEQGWYNSTWTQEQARVASTDLNGSVQQHTKFNSWVIPSFIFQGYPLEYLLNPPMKDKRKIWDSITQHQLEWVGKYHHLLNKYSYES